MRTLYLLRHAKSDWGDARLDDHDRTLTARGERACDVMGELLGRCSPVPGLALSSSARRAVDTVEKLLPHLTPTPPLRIERGLYLAAPSELSDCLAAVEDAVESVLLVGHNPGLHAFAVDLVGRADEEVLDRLTRKLPTAALVHLAFPVDHWWEIRPGRGRLVRFATPRELGAS